MLKHRVDTLMFRQIPRQHSLVIQFFFKLLSECQIDIVQTHIYHKMPYSSSSYIIIIIYDRGMRPNCIVAISLLLKLREKSYNSSHCDRSNGIVEGDEFPWFDAFDKRGVSNTRMIDAGCQWWQDGLTSSSSSSSSSGCSFSPCHQSYQLNSKDKMHSGV